MVGVWCNVRVLLCLMLVRAAFACSMSFVGAGVLVCCCLSWFVVVVLCCVFVVFLVAVVCCGVLCFFLLRCVVWLHALRLFVFDIEGWCGRGCRVLFVLVLVVDVCSCALFCVY